MASRPRPAEAADGRRAGSAPCPPKSRGTPAAPDSNELSLPSPRRSCNLGVTTNSNRGAAMYRILTALLLCGSLAPVGAAGEKRVSVERTPGRGIQPQALADEKGNLHLLYFQGDPAAGNLMYVRRAAGQREFSAPL